jgi:ferredoxin
MTHTAALHLPADGLGALFDALHEAGYTVVGPSARDGAIVYDELDSPADLPRGWTERQGPGEYRLERRSDDAFFGYVLGPHAWKQFLFPPRHRLWSARIADGRFEVIEESAATPRYAFLGVRACELRAIEIQDKVFLRAAAPDPLYAARRDAALVIVVQCTRAAPTCFCTSMNAGPRAEAGYDLAMTEVLGDGVHHFVIEAGSPRGADLLLGLRLRAANADEIRAARAAEADAVAQIERRLDTAGLKERLQSQPEHPHWADVAARCLGCANCTLVCPTCFCHTVEDTTDLAGTQAERWRRMDSCFSFDFSYLHGGSVRQSTAARYRQWLTHKLAGWHDQFGESGCVGCGRCISWCPVGIDLTEEAEKFRWQTSDT